RPVNLRLAQWQAPLAGRGEIGLRPLELPDVRRGSLCRLARLGRRRRPLDPAVADRSRVWPAGAETLGAIGDERKRVQIDLDCLERFCRGDLLPRSDGPNRIAPLDL